MIRIKLAARRIGLSVGLTGCLIASVAQADVPDPIRKQLQQHSSQEQWPEIVRYLGDEHFEVRELANHLLLEAGEAARPALLDGQRNDDREVALRCRQTLLILERYHFRAKLTAFESDYDPQREYDFPGWREFKSIAGDDEIVRSLFVQMQRQESRLLRSIADKDDDLAKQLDRRFQELTRSPVSRSNQSLGATIALLLADTVASQRNLRKSAQATAISRLFSGSARSSFTAGRYQSTTKKVLEAWVENTATSANYYPLVIAMQYDIETGADAARRILETDIPRNTIAQYAINNIIRFGDFKKDEALLEKLLGNTDTVSRTTVNIRGVNGVRKTRVTQVRDLALAGLIHLSKQPFSKFGIDGVQIGNGRLIRTNEMGFEDDEQRQLAIAKWRAYRNPEAPSLVDQPPRPKQ